MTNRQAIELLHALNVVKNMPASINFNYAAYLNRQMLQPVVDATTKARQYSADAAAYWEKYNATVDKYAEKNEKGEYFRTPDGVRVRPGDVPKLQKELAALRKKNSNLADAAEQHRLSVEKLLDADCGVTVRRVAFTELPQQITGAVFEMLMHMVQDATEEIPNSSEK